MAIFRKVVKTDTWERKTFARGGFSIMSTLECGHQVSSRGAAGFAKKRRCHQCEQLAGGMVMTYGNITETWNKDTQMPKRENR